MGGRIAVFLIINFIALGIGGFATTDGVVSEWYLNLNKAPWTPLGWVFGAAWTLIMICFSVYMAYLWPKVENKKFLVALFGVQWVLNVVWNPIFFMSHNVILGLVIITSLLLLIGFFMMRFYDALKSKSLLILPYFIWLIIATSLNAYIWVYN